VQSQLGDDNHEDTEPGLLALLQRPANNRRCASRDNGSD
jgi:hypothetical protein